MANSTYNKGWIGVRCGLTYEVDKEMIKFVVCLVILTLLAIGVAVYTCKVIRGDYE
jgi:phage shock protein PspC (stress-responsive transcriptional regulator)